MGVSRLKFELLDSPSQQQGVDPVHSEGNRLDEMVGLRSEAPRTSGEVMAVESSVMSEFVWPAGEPARSLPVTAEHVAANGWQGEIRVEPRSRPKARAKSENSLMDGNLLRDLASGLEYLNQELRDSDSELEQMKARAALLEQNGTMLEQNARKWQNEHESTRRELLDLRFALDNTRTEARSQQEAWESEQDGLKNLLKNIGAEMADLQAARNQLAEVASQQQRALVLSLELVRRLEEARPQAAEAGENQSAGHLDNSDAERAALHAELAESRSHLEGVVRQSARLQAEFDLRSAQEKARSEFLEDELAQLRGQLTALQDGHESQRRLVVSERQAREAAQQHALEAAEQKSALVRSLQEELTQLRSELSASAEGKARVEGLESVAVQERARAEFFENELAKLRSELVAPPEIEALRAKLEAESVERGVLERELASLRAAIDEGAIPSNGSAASPFVRNEMLKNIESERDRALQQVQAYEAEVTLQTAEVESRGAIITALETALEEQNSSLRSLEERFLAYAEQVQSLQLEQLEMPRGGGRRRNWFGSLFFPSRVPSKTGSFR